MFTIVLTSQRVQFCNPSRANSPAPNGQTEDPPSDKSVLYKTSLFFIRI